MLALEILFPLQRKVEPHKIGTGPALQSPPFLVVDEFPIQPITTFTSKSPQRAVLLSAVTIAAIVGVVLIVSLTAGLEEEYKQVVSIHCIIQAIQ